MELIVIFFLKKKRVIELNQGLKERSILILISMYYQMQYSIGFIESISYPVSTKMYIFHRQSSIMYSIYNAPLLKVWL
jgi:hypothetical protein